MRSRLAVPLLAASAALSGCLLRHPGKSLKQATGHTPTLTLEVHVDPGANNQSYIPVDAVTISDKTLLKEIAAMDSETWFGPKGRCNYRGGKKAKVSVHSWELVPGETLRLTFPVKTDVKQVFLFARYTTPGEHHGKVIEGSRVIDLGATGVHIEAQVPMQDSSQLTAPEMSQACADD